MAAAERGEAAATREPGGPQGPVDVAWLNLERIGDLKEQIADLRRAQGDLRADVKALDTRIDQQGKDLRADIDAKMDNLRNYIVIPVALVLLAAILAHFVPGL